MLDDFMTDEMMQDAFAERDAERLSEMLDAERRLTELLLEIDDALSEYDLCIGAEQMQAIREAIDVLMTNV